MQPTMRIVLAIMAMFALSACGGGGGGGGGGTPVAQTEPTPEPSAPPRAAPNTDPAAPPEAINWRYDFVDAVPELAGSYVAWDGTSMSMRLRHEGMIDIPTNAVLASYVPVLLSFNEGVAWGAIAGDREPTVGEASMSLYDGIFSPTLTLHFSFRDRRELNQTVRRNLTGWQWRDSNGAGAFTTDRELAQDGEYVPTSVYGVERYNTDDVFDPVPVEAAYWAVVSEADQWYLELCRRQGWDC